MLELLIVGAAVFFGSVYLFKFFIFLLGILLSGAGFIIKAFFTICMAVVFFPVIMVLAGGILSSGLIVFLLICALLGAFSYRKSAENRYCS